MKKIPTKPSIHWLIVIGSRFILSKIFSIICLFYHIAFVNFLQSLTHVSKGISSALALGSISAFSKTSIIFPLSNLLTLGVSKSFVIGIFWRFKEKFADSKFGKSCLRLWAKPACKHSKNNFSAFPQGQALGKSTNLFLEISEICSTAESTFGGGLKDPFFTIRIIFGSPKALTERDSKLSLPCCLFSLATILSATSF